MEPSKSVEELRMLVDEQERQIAEMSGRIASLSSDAEWNEQVATEKKNELSGIESRGLFATVWSTMVTGAKRAYNGLNTWMSKLLFALMGLLCVVVVWCPAEVARLDHIEGAVLRASSSGPPIGAECILKLTKVSGQCLVALECESWNYPTQKHECWTETRTYSCGDNRECSEDYMVVGSRNGGERPYFRFDTYTQHLTIQNDENPKGLEIVFFDWVTE